MKTFKARILRPLAAGVILLMFQVSVCFAQEAAVNSPPVKTDATRDGGFFTDIGSILSSPSRWQSSDWTRAFIVLGITAGLYTQDQSIQRFFQRNRGGTTNAISSVATPFGNPLYMLPSIGAFYLYGDCSHDYKAQETALLGVESIVISGGFAQALKFAGHRHRPYTGDPYNTWDGPGFSLNDAHLSFPSIHSSTAFALATVVSSEYGEHTKYVPLFVYSLATLTALSRINDNKHWASDVFFGSAIGYFTTKAILRMHSSDGKTSLLLVPEGPDNGPGLGAVIRF